jgi:hypothetical protein
MLVRDGAELRAETVQTTGFEPVAVENPLSAARRTGKDVRPGWMLYPLSYVREVHAGGWIRTSDHSIEDR